MAFLSINHVALRGVASCVPKHVIENRDVPLFTPEEVEGIISMTGIERRHCIQDFDENYCTSDFCYHAVSKLIEQLGWSKDEIDLLVFVSHTPDYRNPATACILQDRLGLSVQCAALDISLGCSGWIYGMSQIASMISVGRGSIRKALLLTGDTLTPIQSPLDKSRVLLFGDAGTATALEYDENAKPIESHIATDGSGYKALLTPHSGQRHKITPASFKMEDFGNGIVRAPIHSVLEGMDVFSFSISRPPQSVEAIRKHFGISPESVDFYLFHQANKMINMKIVKKLKLPPEKVPMNLKDFGNNSSASIPLLMTTCLGKDLAERPLTMIACGFGVGLSWGSTHFSTDKIVCPALIEV